MIRYRSWPGRVSPGTLWRVASDEPDHMVLPDGVMDLIWSDERLLFAGPDITAAPVTFPAGTVTWGLRLPPGLAHALFGIPACELTGQRIDLADLARLPASMIDAAYHDPAAALDSLVQLLLGRAAVNPEDLALAASLDRAARSGRDVHSIAAQHHLSERSLRRLSDRLFGYGPKTLALIHRFQNGLRLARSGIPLSHAAVAAGYADQSHFARETRRLTGTTLKVLLHQ
ncbi:MAG: helix-turn-helix domain-containing protein [Micrococcales bacterium]|nr:helix-turn-helix domain-containing protein [Micrococcales bacterium]